MRIEGILAKWNDDRGFGFITPTKGGPEVFVHASEFPKNGRRPTVGERLIFEIEIDSAGKKRAKNLLFPRRPPEPPARQSISRRSEKPAFFSRVIALVVVGALAYYGYSEYSRRVAPKATVAAQSTDQPDSSIFHCDGRLHCSQMTSCAEAKLFLRNCPNVQMDGNNDGVPCEQQWCTGIFAK